MCEGSSVVTCFKLKFDKLGYFTGSVKRMRYTFVCGHTGLSHAIQSLF